MLPWAAIGKVRGEFELPKKAKWNELPCPECKEPVAVDAKRCPHCQAVYSEETVQARTATFASTQKFGFGCMALVAVLFLGFCAWGGSDDEEGSGVSTAAPAAGTASQDATAAVVKLQSDIMEAVRGCDSAASSLADAAQGAAENGSVYEAYGAASRVEDACRGSYQLVREIEVGSALTGAAEDRAEETLETCENAMIAKQMGGATMAEVFDGDMRPSKVQEATENAEAGQLGVMACVAGIYETAGAAGVSLDALATE